MQVALHARQRRDHDDRVENDHEVAGRGKAENPAEAAFRCKFVCHLSSLPTGIWVGCRDLRSSPTGAPCACYIAIAS